MGQIRILFNNDKGYVILLGVIDMEIGGSSEGAAIIALLFIGYIVYFKYFY